MSTQNDIYGNDWINAQKFGFVADGITPNDDTMEEYLVKHGTVPLYFSEGVYAFERTIAFADVIFLHLDPKAELKCIAKEPLDYFITLRANAADWVAFENYSQQSFIRGGIINANFSAKTALGVHGGFHTHYHDFEIRNVLEKGIHTDICELKDGCSYFDNILIYNSKAIKGTVGIYDYGFDCTFSYCTVINFETGIQGGGTCFEHVSCWFNTHGKELIPTSVYANITGGNPLFVHPMCDTYRVGFRLSGSANVGIENMTWLTNDVFYPNEARRDERMLVFDAESDNNRIVVNGLYLPWREYFDFSNIPLPSSSFMGVRYPAAWPASSEMQNFRDDSAILREMIEAYKKTKEQ